MRTNTELEPTPEEQYSRLISKYTQLTNRIRSLERHLSPLEERLEVDKERSAIHRQIEGLGLQLGKTIDDVRFEMFLDQGNLVEYGVKVPLLRLPLTGIYFRYEGASRIVVEGDMPPSQCLFTPNGDSILRSVTPNLYYHKKGPPTISGAETEIEKWGKSPYFAIIFTDFYHPQDLYSATTISDWFTIDPGTHSGAQIIRTKLRGSRALAEDFGLNIYVASDNLMHNDRYPHFLEGVEVPGERVKEIALAIASNPGKYWPTEQELKELGRIR